jgi:hypothetical protein
LGSSLATVAREIAKYSLELVGIKAVIWEMGGTEPVGHFIFSYWMGDEDHELGTIILYAYVRKAHHQLRR